MRARSIATTWTLALVLPVALIGLWELAAQRDWIDTLFYPAPSRVIDRTWDQLLNDDLLSDIGATAKRLLIGFALGALPGIALGLAAGVSLLVRRLVYPLATALYVVPRIAMLPLVLVWLSIGDEARIFMVAFSVFFIAFFETLSGASGVNPVYANTARAFGAGRARVAATVLIPGAAPAIFNGLRVAMGFALIVIVGTEFLAANDGLGARIWMSYQIFDITSMYAGIVAVTALGVLLNAAILALEHAALPWKRA